jgi:hypothetical protein
MGKRAVCPDIVQNEVLLPARGETVYWLALADEDVELLSRAECSEAVARQAWQMLAWKRLNARRGAQRLQEGPSKPLLAPRNDDRATGQG